MVVGYYLGSLYLLLLNLFILRSTKTISDLEVRVNNNCGTPLNTGFRSFTDVNDILKALENSGFNLSDIEVK